MFHVKHLLSALLVAAALVLPCPALGAEEPSKTYEQAVEELQAAESYATEEIFESKYGTVFLYTHGPNPHGQHGFLALVTKAFCAKGEGVIIGLPQPRNSLFCFVKPPHAMALSEDGKVFTYSYHYDDPVLSIEYKILRSAGDYDYTVDLTTGEVTEKYTPLGYEKTLARLTEGSENEKVVQVVEGSTATAVLWYWDNPANEYNPEGYQSYCLYLVFRDDNAPEAFCRLLLPSTTYLTTGAWAPTDRGPDSMGFSEDGKTLTYTYVFDAPLSHGDTVYHEAGTYTYTVDTATGELKVEHEKEPAEGPETGPEGGTSPEGPSLGAEGTTFVDIAPSDWFAPYVQVCAEEGLMKGVGGGRFDPQGTVTMAEAATIAARLHHIRNGGDGNLPKAPQEWGRVTLTFADGESFSFYSSTYDPDLPNGHTDGWSWGGRTGGLLYFTHSQGWEGRDYQRVTLTGWSSDAPLQGTAEVPNNEGTSLRFIPKDFDAMWDALRWSDQTPPSKWYRDTDYYLSTQDLGFSCGDYYAQREELVWALDRAVGELPAINRITDYPDSSTTYDEEVREGVLRLYNAGILTGTDRFGSFSPHGYLTRAEVAAMAARILRPELRLAFSPAEPVYQNYTLTELEGVSVESGFERLSPDLLQFDRVEGERRVGESLLRADGTVIDLPEGVYLSQYTAPTNTQPWPLLILCRHDMTMPREFAYGVMDPLTGEMVVPLGPYAGYDITRGGACVPVENGRMILTREATWDDQTWVPLLLRDEKGQVLRELPEREGLEVRWDRLASGLAPAYDQATGLWGFVDMEGKWAIQPQYCNYDSLFVQGRAVVCREDENGNWRYGVIDPQGREVLPCIYPDLSYRGEGLSLAGHYALSPRNSYWLREDGSQIKNGYVTYDMYCINGYFALHNRYLDQEFQYATPAVFDWTGPINETGSGFVGMDGKVYRIQFEQKGERG